MALQLVQELDGYAAQLNLFPTRDLEGEGFMKSVPR